MAAPALAADPRGEFLVRVVQTAQDHGLGELLGRAAGTGTGTGWPDLLRLAGVAALGANAVDNLPSNLAMEPVAVGTRTPAPNSKAARRTDRSDTASYCRRWRGPIRSLLSGGLPAA